MHLIVIKLRIELNIKIDFYSFPGGENLIFAGRNRVDYSHDEPNTIKSAN